MRWEDRDRTRWIHLSGELDHEGCVELVAPFKAATQDAPDAVVVDMSDVTFVGSQGLRLLLQTNAALKERGSRLAVRGLSPHVRKVFETTGLFHAIAEHEG